MKRLRRTEWLEKEIEILEGTFIVFGQKGLKFTMDDLSNELNISKKTIYVYFISKECLLENMVDYAFYRIRQKKSETRRKDLPIEEKIYQEITCLPDIYYQIDIRKLDALRDRYPRVHRKMLSEIESNWDETYALLEEGMKQGVIKQISLPVVKGLIAGAVEVFLSATFLTEEGVNYTDALNEAMKIIMEGIRVHA